MGCLTKPQSTSDFLPYVVGGAFHTGRKGGRPVELDCGLVRSGWAKKRRRGEDTR